MGQAESQPQDGNGPHAGASSSRGAHGGATLAFHVLRVAEDSPAAEAGVEPFFDFIVGAAGTQLGDDLDLLTDVLEENEGREVALQIYSTKRKEVREVYVIPSRTWSSTSVQGTAPGSVDGEPSLLGLSLRLCSPHHALDQVWHVLEILEGSPAQSAGLVPYGDWIIGYAGGVLRGEGDFYDVVEAHVEKPLRLFVYNSDYDVTREAILVPNRDWGGEGLLGCGVGYGLLHRIPRPQDRARVPAHQPYDDDPYQPAAPLSSLKTAPAAAGARGPAAMSPPPPPPPSQRPAVGQSAPAYRSPPYAPANRSDRLTSFSSTPGKMSNPLYAPPPPHAAPPPPPPPAGPPLRGPASASVPGVGTGAGPRAPARRTAALASYGPENNDNNDDDTGGGGAERDAHGYGTRYPTTGGAKATSYDDDPYGAAADETGTAGTHGGGYSSSRGGGGGDEYDASEGVEVVAVHDGEDSGGGDFAPQERSGRGQGRSSLEGGYGGAPPPRAGGYRYGSYGGSLGGVARVVAEEAADEERGARQTGTFEASPTVE